MKKSKLIASLCTLVLTLACLTFGVYSAVKTTFTASGTIVFNAYNIDLDVKGTIKGTAEAVTDFYATTTYSETAKTDATRQTYNQNNLASGWNFGNIAFDELGANSNGYIDNTITITLSFTNYSGFPVKVNVEQTSTNANLTITKNDIQYISKYDTSTLATADTQVVTIIITPNGTAISKESLVFNVTAQPSELTEATESELTYTITDGKAVISAYTGTSDTFVIPSKVVDNDTTYATSLNAGSYDSTTSISTAGVTLPSTVTAVVIPGAMETVSEMAFASNTSLQSVTFCSGVKTIGRAAFKESTALINISWGDTIQTVDMHAFASSNASKKMILEKIILPDSITTIGMVAFQLCDKLNYIKLPNNEKFTTINVNTFGYCSSLKYLELPDNILQIGPGAFTYCTSLESISFSANLKTLNYLSFNGCSSLKNVLLPANLETFTGAFVRCANLTKVVIDSNNQNFIDDNGCIIEKATNKLVYANKNVKDIPSYVKIIGDRAFDSCSDLTQIVVSNTIKQIGDAAFNACTGLTSVTIGSAVTSIGPEAFNKVSTSCVFEFKDTTGTWSSYAATWDSIKCTFGRNATATRTDLTVAEIVANNGAMLRSGSYFFEKNS